MLRTFTLFLSVLLVSACGTKSDETSQKEINSSEIETKAIFSNENDSIQAEYVDEFHDENNFETYYVVVADTNLDYSFLRTKMFEINQHLDLPIDTMGRYYNKKKELIALPDDDEDELYAGEYFPRRFPSKNLSLEYLTMYKEGVNEKTIALIAGIYETKKSADSALLILQKNEKKAFQLSSKMYIGCMH